MQEFFRRNPFFEIAIVAVLVIAAFAIRFHGFKNGGRYTFDEALYVTMAKDMMYDLNYYNGINYSTMELQHRPNRNLPDYLFKKLFKHPPMYCFLIMFSYSMHNKFGLSNVPLTHQAVKASIATGVLTVLVVYLLGRLLFSPMVGLLAAFFMVIDPVHWITSQKIWMDTTITFFMTLSGLFYIYALRKKGGSMLFYILTGLSIGAAALTKYPGGIVFLSVLLFTALFRMDLLKKPKWLLIPASMIIMLVQWFLWNLEVYGLDHFVGKGKGFEDIRAGFAVMGKLLPLIMVATGIIGVGYFLWRRFIKNKYDVYLANIPVVLKRKIFWSAVTILMIAVIVRNDLGYIIRALSFGFEPATSWKMGFFADEPWYFYFRRLFIYFPIYFFAYIAVVFYPYKEKNEFLVPVFYFGVIAAFFILWGNYQCRYFLPAIPWLLLFAAFMIVHIHNNIGLLNNRNMRMTAYVCLWGIVVLCVAKAVQIDILLAWTNKPCYF